MHPEVIWLDVHFLVRGQHWLQQTSAMCGSFSSAATAVCTGIWPPQLKIPWGWEKESRVCPVWFAAQVQEWLNWSSRDWTGSGFTSAHSGGSGRACACPGHRPHCCACAELSAGHKVWKCSQRKEQLGFTHHFSLLWHPAFLQLTL